MNRTDGIISRNPPANWYCSGDSDNTDNRNAVSVLCRTVNTDAANTSFQEITNAKIDVAATPGIPAVERSGGTPRTRSTRTPRPLLPVRAECQGTGWTSP